MPCCAVSDRFSFDTIFLPRKEEANEGDGGAGGRGSFGGLVDLGSHEELDVVKGEGGGDDICPARSVFPRSEGGE